MPVVQEEKNDGAGTHVGTNNLLKNNLITKVWMKLAMISSIFHKNVATTIMLLSCLKHSS